MSNNSESNINETAQSAGSSLPNCASNNGKRKVAISHTITDINYAQMIEAYFGSSNPVDTTLSNSDIFTIIGTEVSPGVFPDVLEFTWDPNTNAITVSGAAGAPNPGPNAVCYSVCLFNGINLLDNNPDTFVFTQAKDLKGNDTVIFKSLLNNNEQHYYDCSNDNP